MFEEWKEQMNRYLCKELDRRPFRAIADELDADVAQLSDHYTAVLLAAGVIDEHGDETELDFDEDDLVEAMLERFLANHPCDEARAALYAALVDAYLSLVEEASEDL